MCTCIFTICEHQLQSYHPEHNLEATWAVDDSLLDAVVLLLVGQVMVIGGTGGPPVVLLVMVLVMM